MDANFADPIQDPTSGETAILTLGTLAEGSTFSFEHWDSGRMGDETSALLAGTATNWLNLYGITDGSESVGNQQSLLTRSTWLKVTGGSYNRIVGGRTNGHAGNISEGSGNGANTVTGDFNVQLSGQGTTARNIIGGFYGTGDGYNNDADGAANTPCTLTGDTKVVVTDGATVTGGIIGGSAVRFVAANETFTHDGSSSVTVRTILGAPNTNADNNVTAAGGSGRSVTVAGAATLNLISGTFTGSLLPTANNASVTGAKELIIGTSADNEPTVDLSNARTIGNTKTTTATPFDTITVRTDLKLGTHRFTDTVIKSDDDTKVHNLTVTVTPEELAAMAGTHSETGGAYYPGAIDLGPFDGWVADDFTLTVENEDTLTMPVQYEQATWGLAVRTIDNTDHLCVVLENRDPNLIWEEANAGATDDWMAGLPNFIPNDRVTFKANRNNAAETVNIGNKAYTLGAIAFTEGGNYTLAGTGSLTAGTTTANGATLTVETMVNAGNTTLTDTDLTVSGDATLSADTLTLDGASTLHLGTKPYSFRYVRFTFTGVVGNQEGLVLFDLELLRDGEKVPWNGATGTNDAARLMDGTSNNWSKAHPTATIPVSVAFDAGDGKVFTFDAYRLAMTRNGNNPANPCGWEVWVSDAPAMNADNTALSTTTNESTGWTRVDTQCYNRDESWGEWPNDTATVTNGWTYSVYPASTASITATTTINGTLAGRGHVYGTVTFGDGSVIDVSGADRGFIAVDGVPTITAKADGSAGQVRILAPDDFVGEELQLFGWNGLNQADDVPPAGMTQESFVLANGTNGTLPCYDLEVRPSGVYMVNKTVVYDAANTKLTEVHDPMPTALYNELRMLATQEGKREVHVVAYTRGNTAFAKQWASVYAPQVFQGDGLYEFAQDGDRDVLKVSYEFGISRLWFSTDDTGTTQVNVTATLSSVDDTTGDLTFVPGSIVRLRAEKTQADDYGNAVYIGDPLATETVGEGVHEVTFTIPYTNLESVMQDSNFKGLRVEIVTSAGK